MKRLLTTICLVVIVGGILSLRTTLKRMQNEEWLAEKTNPDQFEFIRCVNFADLRSGNGYFIPGGSWTPLGDYLCEVKLLPAERKKAE